MCERGCDPQRFIWCEREQSDKDMFSYLQAMRTTWQDVKSFFASQVSSVKTMSCCDSDTEACSVNVCWGSFRRHREPRCLQDIWHLLQKREQRHGWEQQRAEEMTMLYELRMMSSVLSRFGEFASRKVTLRSATSSSCLHCDDEQTTICSITFGSEGSFKHRDYKERSYKEHAPIEWEPKRTL